MASIVMTVSFTLPLQFERMAVRSLSWKIAVERSDVVDDKGLEVTIA